MEDCRKLFNELNDINLLIQQNLTNEIIVPTLSWIYKRVKSILSFMVKENEGKTVKSLKVELSTCKFNPNPYTTNSVQ